MTITTYDLLGHPHEIRFCVSADILTHFDKIKDVVQADEKEEFLERMQVCVEKSTAFAVADDSCFLYYSNYSKGCAAGVAMYGKSNPAKLLAMFAGVFTVLDKDTFKLNFSLHKGKTVSEYKSLLTLSSIKKSKLFGTPLVVRTDFIKKRVNKLHKKGT
jgi:hypothetical protein